jgi:hypothetical protein
VKIFTERLKISEHSRTSKKDLGRTIPSRLFQGLIAREMTEGRIIIK